MNRIPPYGPVQDHSSFQLEPLFHSCRCALFGHPIILLDHRFITNRAKYVAMAATESPLGIFRAQLRVTCPFCFALLLPLSGRPLECQLDTRHVSLCCFFFCSRCGLMTGTRGSRYPNSMTRTQ